MTKKGRLLRFMTRANRHTDNPLWTAKQYWKNEIAADGKDIRYLQPIRVVANGYDGRGIMTIYNNEIKFQKAGGVR